MKYMKPAAIFIFVLAAGMAGREDADSAQREFERYCRMVEQGHWPDFKNAHKECEDAKR